MKTIKVCFSVDVPEDATDEEIQEWLDFELGARGDMSLDNPCDGDICANSSVGIDY